MISETLRSENNYKRLEWDDYFLELAKTVSLRGDCTRSRVGAVLVDPYHRVVSTGYNGVPPGAPGCLSGACPRGWFSYGELPSTDSYENCIALHAERNTVAYADPERRFGTTIYVTRRPCTMCKELLLAEGVSRVVWLSADNIKCTETLFE